MAVTSPWAVPAAAFLGAVAAVVLVYRISLVGGRRLDPRVLLLGGVVVGAFAAALMSAIIALSPAP
jgi:ABC-type Fe3+-siderophore transport system permease subunit